MARNLQHIVRYLLVSFLSIIILFVFFIPMFSVHVQAAENTLLFLGNKNIPPVISLTNDIPTGIAIDMVSALQKFIDTPIKVVAMDWTDAQSLVATGAADALIQINQTEERKLKYDFSDTFLQSDFKIFTQSDNVNIFSEKDLIGHAVGVERGGLPQIVLAKDPLIHLVIIPNFIDGFNQLVEKKIDAVVVDYRVGAYVIASNNLRGIKIVGNPIASSYSSIAVKKGNAELLYKINIALKQIKSDGTYENILKKWEPKEVIFQTREQIRENFMYLAIFVLVILLTSSLLWLFVMRRELLKRIKAEKYAKKIIDSANVIIICLDKNGTITEFNGSAERITGYKKIEVLHRNLLTLFNSNTKLSETWNEFEQNNHIETEINDFIRPIKTKSGAEKIIEWRNSNLYENGEKIGIISFGIDITEKKREEEQLKYSEQKFAAAFHSAPFLIAITKFSDGTIIDVNEGFTNLLGYSHKESVGKTTTHLNIWEKPIDRDHFVASLKKDGYVHNFKTILIRKDNTPIIVLDSAQIIEIDGEKCILSIAYDITKEAQLEEAKDTYLRLLAHHMRTIPGAIKWIMELLSPKIKKHLAAEELKLWHSLDDSDTRLIELANTVSAAAQTELKKVQVIPVPCDLPHLIDEKINTYQEIIKTKQLNIQRDYQDIKQVTIDKNLVGKIISVLLSNAVRYTEPKGFIEIQLSGTDHKFKLIVKDSGLGIPKDQQEKVFSKFFRGNNVAKIDVIGLGLGLFIAKALVTQLKGKLWFESKESKGSTFYLELPC